MGAEPNTVRSMILTEWSQLTLEFYFALNVFVSEISIFNCRSQTFELVHEWVHVQFNLLNPTGHVMHKQFNIKQLYVLPTLYLCVLYLSENKQRLVPLTA